MAWSMASKQTTSQADRTEPGSAAASRGHTDEAARRAGIDPTGAGTATAMTAEIELAMSDLVADADGEVVFFNDSGLRRLTIATDAAVVAEGRAGAHRTAAGQDVTGLRFMTFDNGLRLYYQAGLDVVIRGARSV
jgi:hypothetical protein